MSFATRKAADVIKSGGGGTSEKYKYVLMYDLVISREKESKRDILKLDKDGEVVYSKSQKVHQEIVNCCSEEVIFLGQFDDCPAISFHRKGKYERVLSNYTFPDSGNCPVSDYFFSFEDSADRKKRGCKVFSRENHHLFPVLVLNKQEEPLLTNKGAKISPVMWFDLNCTDFKNDTKGNTYYTNWDRLRKMNEKFPIHEFVYKIYYTPRGEEERQKVYFQPVRRLKKEVFDSIVKVTGHPLVNDWWDSDLGKYVFDEDYYNIVHSLAILKTQKWVDPETGEVFDYSGYYDEAIKYFNEYVDRFPPVTVGGRGKNDDGSDVKASDVMDDEDLHF